MCAWIERHKLRDYNPRIASRVPASLRNPVGHRADKSREVLGLNRKREVAAESARERCVQVGIAEVNRASSRKAFSSMKFNQVDWSAFRFPSFSNYEVSCFS